MGSSAQKRSHFFALVVDGSDPADWESVRKMFQESSFKVLRMTTAKSALKFLGLAKEKEIAYSDGLSSNEVVPAVPTDLLPSLSSKQDNKSNTGKGVDEVTMEKQKTDDKLMMEKSKTHSSEDSIKSSFSEAIIVSSASDVPLNPVNKGNDCTSDEAHDKQIKVKRAAMKKMTKEDLMKEIEKLKEQSRKMKFAIDVIETEEAWMISEIQKMQNGRPLMDIILIDYNLTDMTGLQLLKKLKGTPELREVPMVIICSEKNPARTVQLLEECAIGVIYKPVQQHHVKEIQELMIKTHPSSIIANS